MNKNIINGIYGVSAICSRKINDKIATAVIAGCDITRSHDIDPDNIYLSVIEHIYHLLASLDTKVFHKIPLMIGEKSLEHIPEQWRRTYYLSLNYSLDGLKKVSQTPDIPNMILVLAYLTWGVREIWRLHNYDISKKQYKSNLDVGLITVPGEIYEDVKLLFAFMLGMFHAEMALAINFELCCDLTELVNNY
jgi:hypothetical protein